MCKIACHVIQCQAETLTNFLRGATVGAASDARPQTLHCGITLGPGVFSGVSHTAAAAPVRDAQKRWAEGNYLPSTHLLRVHLAHPTPLAAR